jgi:hypothetical protein
MDTFEYYDAKKAPSPKNSNDLIWNVLSILVLLGAFIIGMIFLLIFINPQSSFNPFPPPTEVALAAIAIPTATNTPRIQFEPTWTPKPTLEPSSTPTLRPSATPPPSATPALPPTDTPLPGSAESQYSFVMQQGSPKAVPNIYHPDRGCNWMGVGGQATSLNGSPVIGIFVQLGGTLEGSYFETRLSMTGTAVEYGRGGYEFEISDQPVLTHQTLWIQLLDQAGLPLSDKIYFDTYADCEKNLILINFVQVK